MAGRKKRQSNLVDHARKELELLGEDKETIAGYLNVIQAFADMGHSGGSAMCAIPVINRLLSFENLTPLTDSPDEWMAIDAEIWGEAGAYQSRRNSEAFSTDGGKTYYLLSEKERAKKNKKPTPIHTTNQKET